jgi:site-specific recombinase
MTEHRPHNIELPDDHAGLAARRAVCHWLRANGVDPDITPLDPQASVSDGMLTILQKVRHGGSDVIDPDDPQRILTETITVPVVVEPTGLVATWLAPKCPTCGR